jgi:hypothetical protein
MTKQLEYKGLYAAKFIRISAGELVKRELRLNEDDLRDSDAVDQAQRVEATRECVGRLLDVLYETGVISAESITRIAGDLYGEARDAKGD